MAMPLHSVNAIGSFKLPAQNVVWVNRWQRPQVDQQIIFPLAAGAVHIREQAVLTGESIVLDVQWPRAYLTAAQLAALRALEAVVGAQYAFAWQDRQTLITENYTVVFDRRNGPGVDFDYGTTRWMSSEQAYIVTHAGQINLMRIV